jgi:hypothetical protein
MFRVAEAVVVVAEEAVALLLLQLVWEAAVQLPLWVAE